MTKKIDWKKVRVNFDIWYSWNINKYGYVALTDQLEKIQQLVESQLRSTRSVSKGKGK